MTRNEMYYNPASLELAVLTLLEKICNKYEPIYTDYLLTPEDGQGTKVMVDFYLPRGCALLNWKNQTCVEVKSRLTTNALDHFRRIASISPEPVILITYEDYGPYKFADIIGRWTIVNFEKFSKECNQLIEKNSSCPTDLANEADAAFHEKDSDDISHHKDYAKILAKNAFKDGNLTLFLGAGVSVGAGLPRWDTLLEELLKDPSQFPLNKDDYAAIDIAAFKSPLITARYLLCPFINGKDDLNGGEKLRDALYKNYKPSKKSSELINTIVRICGLKDSKRNRYVSSIITFNYDDLIEKALGKKKIPYVSIANEGKYELGKLPVIHVHGVLRQNESNPLPILSEEAYHTLYDTINNWANVEIVHALYRNTCIFIGLSMSDPNLRRLLESVRQKSDATTFHYAILPLESLENNNWNATSPTKYYKKDQDKERSFKLRQVDVYLQLGIKVLWYTAGKYEEIPRILKEIAGISKS